MRRLAERFERLVNPILVKEMHQGMRRRELGVGGALGLLAPVATYLVVVSTGSADLESVREAYFAVVFGMVIGLSWLVIPVGSAQQLHGELKTRTLELLALTRLTPWELVSGRFLASLVKLCLVLSFAGPFTVVAILMGATDLEDVATLFALAVSGCSLMSSLALLAITPTLTAPGLGRLVVVGVVMVLMSGASLFGGFFGLGAGATGGSALISILWLAASTLAATLFFLRLTADVFAPPGRRMYALSKLAFLPFLASVSAPLWTDTLIWPVGYDPRRGVLLAACLFLLFAFTLLWSASRPLDGARDGRWPLPLRNGFDAALVYAALLTLLMAGLCVLNQIPWRYPALALGFYTLFTGLGALLQGMLPAGRRTVENYLLMLLILAVVNVLATSVVAVQHPQVVYPSADAFLPLRLLTNAKLVEHPRWLYAAPGVVGLIAMLVARARQARAAQHG